MNNEPDRIPEAPVGAPSDLEAIRARAEAATPGPWWYDQDERMWRLHGVQFVIPPQGPVAQQVIGRQILKAPKKGTPYAEYWPSAPDAEFIAHARTDVDVLLQELDRLQARLAELNNALNWDTACLRCSATLDACYRETVRAERAEAQRDRARAEHGHLLNVAHSQIAEWTALFELQQSRMHKATALWQQEDPATRKRVLPDLGKLLDWLMARHATSSQAADRHRRRADDAHDLLRHRHEVVAAAVAWHHAVRHAHAQHSAASYSAGFEAGITLLAAVDALDAAQTCDAPPDTDEDRS